jgi:hypothetical protein
MVHPERHGPFRGAAVPGLEIQCSVELLQCTICFTVPHAEEARTRVDIRICVMETCTSFMRYTGTRVA